MHIHNHLVSLHNAHLVLAEGISPRSEMNSLAMRVHYGGVDTVTSKAEKGMTAFEEQIQQLATMDITRYDALDLEVLFPDCRSCWAS